MIYNFPVFTTYFVYRNTWPGWSIGKRKISNYELVFVTKGRGKVHIEDKAYEIERGNLLFFSPDLYHSIRTEDRDCLVFFAVHFESEERFPILPYNKLHNVKHIEDLFETMNSIHHHKAYLYQWNENLILQNILLEICKSFHREKYSSHSEVCVQRIIEYVHKNVLKKIKLEDLQKLSGLGKTTFFQVFHQITGMTPMHYVNKIKLEYARDLLLRKSWSVTRIAQYCGYDDVFYFSKCFKNEFGISPKKYRQETEEE